MPSAVGYHSSDIGLGDDEFWTQMKEEPTSPSASSTSPPPPQAELTKEETQFYEAAKVRMTALQRMQSSTSAPLSLRLGVADTGASPQYRRDRVGVHHAIRWFVPL
jgi:hypothetical protein